jgi:peptidoglycan/xylan/chitin deacetylase (PgdA/CDA1 family)
MGDVLVLCYHAVSDRWPAMMALPEGRLERQLAHLVERGYRGATFSQAVSDPPARRTLAVTFDDGLRSVIERALPILSRLGLPGTVFVPSAFVDGPGPRSWSGPDRWLETPHERELEPMSWRELDSLAQEGWEIGSHTRTHPRLTELDDDLLAEELRGSRADCEERLGRPCRSIAYPYGDVDGRVVRAAKDAGYDAAAGLPMRLHRRRPLDWPRVGIYRNDPFPRFLAKVSRTRRYLIGSRAGEAIVRGGLRLRSAGPD